MQDKYEITKEEYEELIDRYNISTIGEVISDEGIRTFLLRVSSFVENPVEQQKVFELIDHIDNYKFGKGVEL